MQPKSDVQLLREYAEHGNESAFCEIVVRHTDLVYSAALRQVNSPDVARDVAQNVFADLARKANSVAKRLGENSSLVGWLYRGTRFEALDLCRNEFRRQLRERQAMEQLLPTSEPEPDWNHLRPVLDEAMEDLSDADRDALLLRFFKNQDLREVGVALGVSDDAAQKRVSRALEKLRESLSRRGVTTAVTAMTVVISANAVQAAPAGLAVTISTAAVLTGTTVSTSTAIAATKTIAMTTAQKILIATTFVAVVGAGMYETRQASSLREQNLALARQQTPLAEQVQQMQSERVKMETRLATLESENAQLKSNQSNAELLRLRGQVTQLRAAQQQTQSKTAGLDANDPALQNFLAVKAQAQQISNYLEQMPDKKIPELKFLTDVDWLTATKEAKFDTDADVRKTLSRLRDLAKNRMPIGRSLWSFTRENDGQLPTDMAQLKPYFKAALDTSDDAIVDAILARYKIVHSGKTGDLPKDAWVIVEKAPVDKDYDTRAKFGPGTSTIISTGIGEAGDPEDKNY